MNYGLGKHTRSAVLKPLEAGLLRSTQDESAIGVWGGLRNYDSVAGRLALVVVDRVYADFDYARI